MLVVASSVLYSCKKREFDTPPIKEIPTGQVLTVADLIARFDTNTAAPVRFTTDQSVYGIITMDDKSGNIYKAVYMQDRTAAINVRLLSSGGLYVGDSVRINLKGTVLSRYNGLMQLDSVDVDNNVVKQASGVNFAPKVVTIDQITPAMQSQLIKLENVQFVTPNETYADAAAQQSENRMLTDCDGREIIVRTSGYASFAGTDLPDGKGSIVAIVSVFGSDLQLYVRTLGEVKMTEPRCVPGFGDPVNSVNETFDGITVDNATLATPGWLNIATVGTAKWSAQIYQSEKYAEATAYQSADASNEIWLISPRVNNDAVNGKRLSFQSAIAFYKHDGLTVWISTNFDGTNASTANWVQVSATLATSANGNFTWVPSGNVSLAPYLPQGYTGTFVIGFKYVGSNAAQQTTNHRIDNVVIQ